MNAFWIVFRYSFMERIKAKSFALMTVALVLFISAMVWVPKWIDAYSAQQKGEIAVFNSGILLSDVVQLEQQVSDRFVWRLADDFETEKTRLEANELDAIIEIGEVQESPVVTVTVRKKEDFPILDRLASYIQSVYSMQQIEQLSLTAEQYNQLQASVNVQVEETSDSQKTLENMYIPVYLLTFMLYLLIYMFGGGIATAVAVEKSSRVKEILITKVKPNHLLLGKIFGVGSAGLLQFVLILLLSYAVIHAGGGELKLFGMPFRLSAMDGQTLFCLIVFFILGYFFYATLFAATGSLVSRMEQVNQMTMPVSIFIAGAWMFSLVSIPNADSQLVEVLSYIPFFTPFLMFVRVGLTELSWLQIALPILILFVSVILGGLLSAKIYRVGVLLYGQKPTAKLVVKAMRSM